MNGGTTTQRNRDRINLRLNTEVFDLIDKARRGRAGVVSRNTWITEAIQEKLMRELENPALNNGGGHANVL
jgi:hypothetical protein